MKILIDGRVLKHKYTTGVERYTIEVLKAFDKLNLNYELALPFSKIRYLQHIWEHIVLPINSKKYDILFCPANISPIFKFKNIKQVIVIHDLSSVYYPLMYKRSYTLYYNTFTPLMLRISDRIITCSETVKKEISKKYLIPDDKIVAIPNGISEVFLSSDKEIKKEKEKYILCVGTLNPRKNLKRVIFAFKKLLNKIEHKLYIVGGYFNIYSKDSQLEFLLKTIPKDRIKVFGYLKTDEELKKLYSLADCFVFASLYEGSGLPPTEAMACGCPVVVSNIDVLKERCGDAAYYVNPYDVEDIAEGIYKVTTDFSLKEILIKKGLERVKNFSWEKTAKNIIKVFEDVLLR
ncbi:MAG: glycosyltransferase family 1 protein [Candidatus Aenigmarchaeota archaeon]|nr:glycosyltransferase family 4 protein [Candidatus Aenigmarchaeota archaeon]MDW8149102.1 glycosyltransferase family 1 protein [Candidatus Aenigmarchaeota archaeon]